MFSNTAAPSAPIKYLTVGNLNAGCVDEPRECTLVGGDVGQIVEVSPTSITWEAFANDQDADALRRSLLGDRFEAAVGASGATQLACNQTACRVRWDTARQHQ